MKEAYHIWKNIFSELKYWIIFLATALLFYLFNVMISSWSILNEFSGDFGVWGTINLFLVLAGNFIYAIDIYSFVSLIIISLLFGFFVVLLFYKTILNYKMEKKTGILGGIGVFLALFIPGCTVCGLGLVAALGLGGIVLSLLPLKGLEISIISIILLSWAIVKITGNMYSCQVNTIKLKANQRFSINPHVKELKGGNKNGRKKR